MPTGKTESQGKDTDLFNQRDYDAVASQGVQNTALSIGLAEKGNKLRSSLRKVT